MDEHMRQSRERAIRIVSQLLLGPIIWLVHFTLAYALQSTLCVFDVHRIVPTSVTILTVLALAAVAPAVLRWTRKNDNPGGFYPYIMLLLALLSAFGIIWTWLAALLLHPCAPMR
jgi:hypothetical protein